MPQDIQQRAGGNESPAKLIAQQAQGESDPKPDAASLIPRGIHTAEPCVQNHHDRKQQDCSDNILSIIKQIYCKAHNYSCKNESVFNRKISHVILAVTLIGLGLRVLGFTQYKKKNDSGFSTILYFIIPVRLVALFCIYAPFF